MRVSSWIWISKKENPFRWMQYLHMIELKTAVFLAASLQMGAIIAGAGEEDQQHIYAFGKNLGLAFQVQDDWLDSFGNPSTFGKQTGGDILANKKTFLLVHALEKAGTRQKAIDSELYCIMPPPDKVDRMTGDIPRYRRGPGSAAG